MNQKKIIKTKKINLCIWCLKKLHFKKVIETIDYFNESNQMYRYTRCEFCKSLNLIDQPVAEDISKIYNSAYEPYGGSRNYILNNSDIFLRKNIRCPQISILDYGSGSGEYLFKMANLFPSAKLYAVDFDVDAARDRLVDLDVLIYSPEDFLKLDKKFDHVNISHCLEHLSNPIEVLAKVVEVTSDSGVIIIRSPISDSFSSKLFKNYWFGLEAPRHFTVPSKKIFEDFIPNKFGLTLVRSMWYGSPVVF